MSDVINIKDFYNHETRITIVENAVIGIDKRFDSVEKRMESLQAESRTQFRWTMTLIVGLYALFGGSLIAVIKFAH